LRQDGVVDPDAGFLGEVFCGRPLKAFHRVSHPFHEGIAVRLICWFPPEGNTAVVALFSGDKANMGDDFYESVGSRADQIIEPWIRERGG
ncbi:MAG: hypothetical protein ABI568_06885, partial [Pseudarthrobacter sp.]